MKWRHAPLGLLLSLLAACGADGGSRGTGIEALVQGNVESVQSARTTTEGIRVVVEGTGAESETGANGEFAVRGNFDGKVRLLFQRLEDGVNAALPINIPGGGTLTLNNVQIDSAQGEAVPESQNVEFDGVITATDCGVQTLILSSALPNDLDRYTLRLDTSSVYDSQGNPLTCADLQVGDQAMVQGMVNPDGTFGDAVVEVR